MRVKEDSLPAHKEGEKDERLPSTGEAEKLQSSPALSPVQDKEDCSEVCRVCQCVESDKRGEAALEFLGISPPSNGMSQKLTAKSLVAESHTTVLPNDVGHSGKKRDGITDYVEYVSPDGEIFICSRDLESGSCLCHHDALIELGCLCKNDLALAHYACALRWFISHGSIICEICRNLAENVRFADLNKVMAALKECETLRSRTDAGEVTPSYAQSHADVDPDAVAAVRRQRLIEIQSWFNPHSQTTTASHGPVDQASNGPSDDIISNVNPTTKWAVEGTGILVATGLLTVTLAWLIAPRVGKKTARSGLHILLGGLCALTVVVLLRFGVLPRIKYGPARYWAILFVFWFLVFGIWASRTRGARSS